MHSDVIREGVAGGLADGAEEVIRAGHQPTLRDRFAIAALQGLLAADAGERTMSLQAHWCWDAQAAALTAYELADAMLSAREKKAEGA